MMNKALHIMYEYGTQGVGGAATAATRLHLDMVAKGVDSRVVCVWGDEAKWESGVRVRRIWCLRTRWWWHGVRVLHTLTGRWTHAIGLPGFARVLREFDPEEVHIHWIRRDTISWRQLRDLGVGERCRCREKVVGRKIYVHLHDLWALEQPQIVALNPTFVAYSDYVADIVRAKGYAVERRNLILDPVFTKESSNSPVPLPLKTPTFSPPLPLKTPTILFGCKDGRSNPDKGFADLAKALAALPEDVKSKVVLKIFGESAPSCLTSGVRTEFLGRIDDPVRLKALYQEAACFAFPSTSETMGMTKLEALACGCPVVAFDRTACAEGIDHLKTGYVAKAGDCKDFAEGLKWAIGGED